MASNILHIKDSYYFEVPKALWRSHREQISDFPDYWVKLDANYLDWQAELTYDALAAEKDNLLGKTELPSKASLLESYEHWRDHADHGHNAGKPLSRYLEESPEQLWFQEALNQKGESGTLAREKWASIQETVNTKEATVEKYTAHAKSWPAEKIEGYNKELTGKILIPQPFGTLKNLYEPASGFAISKFMIIEIFVAAIICFIFIRLAGKMQKGIRPKGRGWNMFEAILLYFRDHVVTPAIGEHDAPKFTPILWTIFLFILGCNLFGMLPWTGTPTASISVTMAMACVTFLIGLIYGSKELGVVGYWKNLAPSLGMPWYGSIPILIILFPIELLGLLIKHGVLGIRLLANMAAGHLVLLSLMGMATAAAATSMWGVTAGASVIGSALLSCLELFVAFLQAYVFTLLSSIFIGAAIHHH